MQFRAPTVGVNVESGPALRKHEADAQQTRYAALLMRSGRAQRVSVPGCSLRMRQSTDLLENPAKLVDAFRADRSC